MKRAHVRTPEVHPNTTTGNRLLRQKNSEHFFPSLYTRIFTARLRVRIVEYKSTAVLDGFWNEFRADGIIAEMFFDLLSSRVVLFRSFVGAQNSWSDKFADASPASVTLRNEEIDLRPCGCCRIRLGHFLQFKQLSSQGFTRSVEPQRGSRIAQRRWY